MELYEAMRTTAAVREFTDDPLPADTLHRILEHARFAPSGGNRQGTRLVVVTERATRERLAELNEPAVRRYMAQIAAGQSPWNPLEPPAPSPEAIAATDQELDRIGLVAGASVYPLVWNVLLAARTEGFGGTITTMAVAQEPAVRELLGIPEQYAVAAVVPLGRPVQQLTRLRRRPVEELATWERFDGAPVTA